MVYMKDTDDLDGENHHLNMIFYLFWFAFWGSVSTLLMFWMDVIPGFGTANSFSLFGQRMWFNLSCLFGGSECGADIYLLGWATIFVSSAAFVITAFILRYSEGANFAVVVMMLRSPIILLFWTLFDERPFKWHPHLHLTSYLGAAGLVLMLPAIYLYSTGDPEIIRNKKTEEQQAILQVGRFDDELSG